MDAAEMWRLFALPDAALTQYLRDHQPGCWELIMGENPLRQGETLRYFRVLLACCADALERDEAVTAPR